MSYSLIKRPAPGLAVLASEQHGQQLWTVGKMRGHMRICEVCRRDLRSGVDAFRPMTNGYNRSRRICVSCIDAVTPQSGTDKREP
jgi:hypothetical protein